MSDKDTLLALRDEIKDVMDMIEQETKFYKADFSASCALRTMQTHMLYRLASIEKSINE